MSHMDRKTLLKRAGIGAGALAVPAALGAPAAFGLPPNGQRFYAIVAFSQAQPTADVDFPKLLVSICGNFKPDAGWINGGGDWTILDWNGAFGTATLVSSGLWRPRALVDYQSFSPPVGVTEASILDIRADFEGLAGDVPMKLICNIGPSGILTGQPEGFKATIPGYTEFVPFGLGISHTSIEGVRVP
jgi:hypothetical protein